MQCFTCDTVCPPNANFCPSCGRNFRPRATHQAVAPNESGERRRPNAYPHEASLAQWHALTRSKTTKALLWASPLLALGGLSLWVIRDWWFVPFVALILSINAFVYMRRVRPAEYYAIPHSSDAQGQHRCIFCGNRGIYKKGEYKTNNTHSHCSKCEELLFSE
jgi:hypothetical protein